MTKFSPLLPHPAKPSKYDGLHTMGPRFRTGTMSVLNGKPNRGASARATNRFIAEAVVPFPFIGPARLSLTVKRDDNGRYVSDDKRIPTPTINPKSAVRKPASWLATSE